ncbi:hypothetical protein GYD59_004661, partial [Salmonella enterica]|nr:hypothetical protein [Salmonella enterica]
MNDMFFLNKNGVQFPVKICDGNSLNYNIFWSFTTVSLAWSLDADDLQYSLSEKYIGSNHYISDEGYAFDCKSNALTGIFLNVPDENFDGANFLQNCLKSDVIRGIPYALNNVKFSAISSTDYRYLSDNADYLICISRDCIEHHTDILRLQIHERLDLIFINKEHCGFILKDPVRSLVRFADFDIEQNINADTAIDISPYMNLYLLYFKTMNHTAWDNLDEKNERIKITLNFISNGLKDADLSKEP